MKVARLDEIEPGTGLPVEIEGRHYVDGVLNKTVHASVAFEHGAGLVICVNPIVPVDTARAVAEAIGAAHHELDVDGAVQGYIGLVEGAMGRKLTWARDDVTRYPVFRSQTWDHSTGEPW